MFLAVVALFLISNFLRNFAVVAFTVLQNRNLHNKMLRRVTSAKIEFYDNNRLG